MKYAGMFVVIVFRQRGSTLKKNYTPSHKRKCKINVKNLANPIIEALGPRLNMPIMLSNSIRCVRGFVHKYMAVCIEAKVDKMPLGSTIFGGSDTSMKIMICRKFHVRNLKKISLLVLGGGVKCHDFIKQGIFPTKFHTFSNFCTCFWRYLS